MVSQFEGFGMELFYLASVWFLFFTQVTNAEEDLVSQRSIPALLFSRKLSPGLLKYQLNYEPDSVVPVESFKIIAKDLIDQCNSNAYIFVNVPGLRKLDFIKYENEFVFLKRYLNQSSTKLKFEQVKRLSDDIYQELISYTKEKCKFEGHVQLNGNNSDDFAPYLDSGKRIIEINYTPLPLDENERLEAIRDLDKYTRTILAQLPSPDQTVFYTSLKPAPVPEDDYKPTEFFTELFENLNETESNNRIANVAPFINKYHPKFEGMKNITVSLLNPTFFKENEDLIKCIIAVLVGFMIVTIAQQFFMKPVGVVRVDKIAKKPTLDTTEIKIEKESSDDGKETDGEVDQNEHNHEDKPHIRKVNQVYVKKDSKSE